MNAPHVDCSVVIPIHNEAGNIAALHQRLTATLAPRLNYEIIFVDDASTDDSRAMLTALAQRDSHVRALLLTRNFGQHPALQAGIDHCRGDVVVFMDGDLQDRPEEIPKLLAALESGTADIACAARLQRGATWFKRRTSAAFLAIMSFLMRMDVSPVTCTFRAVRRRVIETMRTMPENTNHVMLLMAWLGYPTQLVEVEHGARTNGRTHYPLLRLLAHAGDGLISFSTLPLRAAGWMGTAAATVAFSLGLCFLVRKLIWGVDAVGWASLMVSQFFFGGIMLVFLGFIGEYVGRIFVEIKDRPRYVVRQEVVQQVTRSTRRHATRRA